MASCLPTDFSCSTPSSRTAVVHPAPRLYGLLFSVACVDVPLHCSVLQTGEPPNPLRRLLWLRRSGISVVMDGCMCHQQSMVMLVLVLDSAKGHAAETHGLSFSGSGAFQRCRLQPRCSCPSCVSAWREEWIEIREPANLTPWKSKSTWKVRLEAGSSAGQF